MGVISFESAEAWIFVLGAVGVAGMAVWYLLGYGPEDAEIQVLRWQNKVGLPRDDAARADAVAHRLRQYKVGSMGALTGCAVGIVPLGIIGPNLTGFVGYGACVLLGFGIRSWLAHVDDLLVRADRAATRAAALRRRRLLDYLTPVEVTGLYLSLVMPVIGLTVGVATLLRGTAETTRPIALVVMAMLALVVFVEAIALQRRALRLVQAAESETAMRWEEALRAWILRDATAFTVMLMVMLGGYAAAGALLDGTDAVPNPGFLIYFVGSVIVFMGCSGARRPSAMRRSQRQFEPAQVE